MGRTRLRLPTKSLIALVLVAISFLLLLFPWVNISIEIFGQDYSFPDLIEMACIASEITEAQFEIEIQAEIASYATELADEYGVILDARDATNSINKILDGGITLLDTATICSFSAGTLKDIEQALNLSLSDLSSSERYSLMMLGDARKSVTLVAVALWVIIIALVATFVYAIYALQTDKRVGVIAYAVAVAVPTIAVFIGIGDLNGQLQAYGDFATEIINNLLWASGMREIFAQNFELFHITAAPVFSLLCIIAATVLLCVDKIALPSGGGIGELTKWTCSCGNQNKVGNTFCAACGQKRPEKPRCECGVAIVPGNRFCGKCGKLVESTDIDDIVPPAPPPKRCPNCGSIMDGAVCRRCATTSPQPKKCARCGSPVYGNKTVCESCSVAGGKLSGDLWNRPGNADLD